MGQWGDPDQTIKIGPPSLVSSNQPARRRAKSKEISTVPCKVCPGSRWGEIGHDEIDARDHPKDLRVRGPRDQEGGN